MGEVYRAHDDRLGRDVAVKVLPPVYQADADRLRRFAQEARAAAALNHPNVLAVYDVEIEADVPYVVSELLEGETLRETVQRGPVPLRRAVDLATQIANGLAAAHHKGIVHRDLKPANVFVTADGRAKVLDFGLARMVEPKDADAVSTRLGSGPATSPGAVLGTVGYMSPEQARGEPADARSDIFALGVVCYEMLAGRPTFVGSSQVEILTAILRDDPADLPDSVVPEPLERIVRRCLEKQPAQRFQSASDVAFALEALSGTSLGTRASSLPPATLPPSPSRPVRLPTLAAAVVAGVLVGAAGLWLLQRPAPPAAVTYEAKTFDRRPVMNARFMPDGQTIVYSAATRGTAPELFVINPAAEAPQRMGPADAHLLAVSSKGELALIMNARYRWQRIYAGTFARMTMGSAPRAIHEGVREADWSPDGESLAVIQDLGDGRDRLEYPIGRTLHEMSGYLSDPRVAPDGRQVAFVAHPWRSDDRGTVMVVRAGEPARALTGELWSIEGLAWTPDGSRVVFSGNAAGGSTMEPMTVAADGTDAARPLVGVPGRLIVHDIARDGRWLAVREDVTSGVRARVPGVETERDLSWLGSSVARSLSADGRHLLLVEAGLRSGANYGVVLRGTDGSEGIRLGSGDAQQLSPDGRWAAAIVNNPAAVMVYPTGAGEPLRLASGRFTQIASAAWFPDSRRLLACAAEASRAPRCYTLGLDDAPPTAVTPEGTSAALGPDGTTMLVTASDGAIQAIAVGAAAGRRVDALHRDDRVVGWSRDATAVFVQRSADVPAKIERVDLASGMRTVVREVSPAGMEGLTSVLVANWIDEGGWYAYTYTTVPSTLFVVKNAPAP
jgi:dipeptidyl aminopeptidase/acylaminoacyl peptidase